MSENVKTCRTCSGLCYSDFRGQYDCWIVGLYSFHPDDVINCDLWEPNAGQQKLDRIVELEALIERLVDVGDQVVHPERSTWTVRTLTECWDKAVAEWQAMKGAK